MQLGLFILPSHVLWSLDDFKYSIDQELATRLINTNQLLPKGIVTRDGKKYIKYRVVNGKDN